MDEEGEVETMELEEIVVSNSRKFTVGDISSHTEHSVLRVTFYIRLTISSWENYEFPCIS